MKVDWGKLTTTASLFQISQPSHHHQRRDQHAGAGRPAASTRASSSTCSASRSTASACWAARCSSTPCSPRPRAASPTAGSRRSAPACTAQPRRRMGPAVRCAASPLNGRVDLHGRAVHRHDVAAPQPAGVDALRRRRAAMRSTIREPDRQAAGRCASSSRTCSTTTTGPTGFGRDHAVAGHAAHLPAGDDDSRDVGPGRRRQSVAASVRKIMKKQPSSFVAGVGSGVSFVHGSRGGGRLGPFGASGRRNGAHSEHQEQVELQRTCSGREPGRRSRCIVPSGRGHRRQLRRGGRLAALARGCPAGDDGDAGRSASRRSWPRCWPSLVYLGLLIWGLRRAEPGAPLCHPRCRRDRFLGWGLRPRAPGGRRLTWSRASAPP